MSLKPSYVVPPLDPVGTPKQPCVRDFLPPPEELAVAETVVKITISLSLRSIEFFKEAAARNNTSYQRMIRHLLDSYADQYREELPKRSGRPSTGARR